LMLEQELAERGMTTILIAHRLSTVAKAGRIIVMKDGRVVDQGRYEELMQKDRRDQTFRQLAITQRVDPDVADDDVPEDSMNKEDDALEGKWSEVGPLPVAPNGRDQPITSAFSTSDRTAVDTSHLHDGTHHHPGGIRKPSISRLKRPDIPWTASGRGSTMFQHEHGLEDAASALYKTNSRNTALTDGEDVEQAVSPELEKEERRQSFQRFFKLIKSQKWFFTIGIIGGVLAGGSFPLAGWMTGEAVHSLSDANANPGINTWSLWFLIMAIIDLLIYL
jgi:ATP-binding cassette subfamily B (MDR/TAP) protein 1